MSKSNVPVRVNINVNDIVMKARFDKVFHHQLALAKVNRWIQSRLPNEYDEIKLTSKTGGVIKLKLIRGGIVWREDLTIQSTINEWMTKNFDINDIIDYGVGEKWSIRFTFDPPSISGFRTDRGIIVHHHLLNIDFATYNAALRIINKPNLSFESDTPTLFKAVTDAGEEKTMLFIVDKGEFLFYEYDGSQFIQVFETDGELVGYTIME